MIREARIGRAPYLPSCGREDHRRACRDPCRGLQSDVAAPCRGVRAGRAGARSRAACSTSAAASATASICSPRGRRSASTSTPAALAGQDRETVVADMRALPFPARELRLRAVGPVDRARAGSRAGARRGRARAPAGRRGGVRDPEPADARPAGRDHRSLPPRGVRRRPSSGPCARPGSAACAVRGLFGSPRYMALFDAERRTLDRLLAARPAAAAAGGAEPRCGGGSTTCCCGAPANADDPRAAAIVPEDFELRDDGLGAALDVVADLHGPDRAVTRDCVWCGAPLDGSAVRLRGRVRCAACGAAMIDPWPSAGRAGARLRGLVPAGRRAAASASWATRCCAARAATSPAGSTRSRRPARCSTSAPATAR